MSLCPQTPAPDKVKSKPMYVQSTLLKIQSRTRMHLANVGKHFMHQTIESPAETQMGRGIEFEEKRDGGVLFLHLDRGVIGK